MRRALSGDGTIRAWVVVSDHSWPPGHLRSGRRQRAHTPGHAASHQAAYAHARRRKTPPLRSRGHPRLLLRVDRNPARRPHARGKLRPRDAPEISVQSSPPNPWPGPCRKPGPRARVWWRIACRITAVGHGVAAMGTLATVIVNRLDPPGCEKSIFPHPARRIPADALLAGRGRVEEKMKCGGKILERIPPRSLQDFQSGSKNESCEKDVSARP